MANRLNIDELNNIGVQYDNADVKVKKRSIPFEEYFDEMELTEEQKEQRITLAEKLYHVINALLVIINASNVAKMDFDSEYYKDYLQRGFGAVLDEIFGSNGYSNEYLNQMTSDLVDATQRNIGNSYFTSDDRATYIAENESNAFYNDSELQKAIDDGYTKKQWVTMRDKKVRHTHSLVDGEVIGIFDEFEVGNSLMKYPKDPNGSGEETANCRCVLKFSGKTESIKDSHKEVQVNQQKVNSIKPITSIMLSLPQINISNNSSNEEQNTTATNSQLTKENFHQEPNKTMFWSGVTNSGKNPEIPQDVAKKLGLVTLEIFLETNDIVMPEYNPLDESSVNEWIMASILLAENAQGMVYTYLGDNVREESIWNTYEFPTLMSNTNVTKIIRIDDNGKELEVLFSR